jgi:hypothetical protein
LTVYIRCKSCHGAMWHPGGTAAEECSCGQVYRFRKGLGPAQVKRLGQQAREYAREQGIDLPAAYSIKLGLLTLEQVRDMGRRPAPADRPEPASEPPNGPASEPAGEPEIQGRKYKYDPAFDQAVADGCLTPGQAFERGKREALAQRIAERHGLSMEQAYKVADNRAPLLAVLREQKDQSQPAVVPMVFTRKARPSWVNRAIAAVGLAAIVMTTWVWYATRAVPEGSPEAVVAPVLPAMSETAPRDAPPSRDAVLRSATSVRNDGQGRVVQIVGPDPRSVTIAFCESVGPERRFEVLDVTPSVPPDAGSRLGLIRDLDKNSFQTIPIRRDRETRRWVAGDGLNPIRPSTAPPGVMRALLDR